MAEEKKTASEYVTHHLHHLSSNPHDSQFVTMDSWHFDTLFFSTLLGSSSFSVWWRVAPRPVCQARCRPSSKF
jgi:hypothetical protein